MNFCVSLAPVKQKVVKALEYTLTSLLALALLYFAFGKLDWKAFVDGLLQTSWFWVAASVAASLGALFFRAERWRDMLLPLDGNISRKKVWDAYNFGNFCSVFVPGVGEIVRAGAVSTKKTGYDRAFGTAVMERAWDLVAIAVIFVAAIVSKHKTLGTFVEDSLISPVAQKLSLWWIVVLLVLVGAAALFAVYHWRGSSKLCGKMADFIDGILQGLKAFKDVRHKGKFILLTVAVWACYILMSLFVFKAMPGLEHLDFGDALLVSAIGNLASVIPVPGGLGAYHYLVALTLSTLYGSTWESGLLFATLTHETRSLLLIVVAAISYVSVLVARSSTKTKQ